MAFKTSTACQVCSIKVMVALVPTRQVYLGGGGGGGYSPTPRPLGLGCGLMTLTCGATASRCMGGDGRLDAVEDGVCVPTGRAHARRQASSWGAGERVGTMVEEEEEEEDICGIVAVGRASEDSDKRTDRWAHPRGK